MRLGSPSRAMSALLDRHVCEFNPALGRGTICVLLILYMSGRLLGSGTGTESGYCVVSHRKNLEAHGRMGRELGREVAGTTLGQELIIFSSEET